MFEKMSSEIFKRAVAVLCFFLNPDCKRSKRLFSSKYANICFEITFSNILLSVHNKLIGRKSESLDGFGILGIGMTLAFFQLDGKTPLTIEQFME